MTAEHERRVPVPLDAEQTGTLLGAAAWVLGALQIMRDRGHAQGDEDFHQLYEQLEPRLDALIRGVGAARAAGVAGADPAFQGAVETAYQAVREAFEDWIRLTAADTLSVALGERLAERLQAAEDGAEGEAGDPPQGR